MGVRLERPGNPVEFSALIDMLGGAEPQAGERGSLVRGKSGGVEILDAVRACAREVMRSTARAGVTVSVEMPAFVDRVLVDQADFRRTIASLVKQVLSDTPSGRQLSVTFSLPSSDLLAIEVYPASDTAHLGTKAIRTAHLPIRRGDA